MYTRLSYIERVYLYSTMVWRVLCCMESIYEWSATQKLKYEGRALQKVYSAGFR